MFTLEIDQSKLKAIVRELGASDKQVRMSVHRALNRTATTLRKLSSQGLKTELELRNAKLLRRRLKTMKIKSAAKSGVRLFYGLNDMPISAFKGSSRKTSSGVKFRNQIIQDAFIGKNNHGKRTVFKRKSSARYPIDEYKIDIKERADDFLQNKIFVQVEAIFINNFKSDLRARTIYGVGR